MKRALKTLRQLIACLIGAAMTIVGAGLFGGGLVFLFASMPAANPDSSVNRSMAAVGIIAVATFCIIAGNVILSKHLPRTIVDSIASAYEYLHERASKITVKGILTGILRVMIIIVGIVLAIGGFIVTIVCIVKLASDYAWPLIQSEPTMERPLLYVAGALLGFAAFVVGGDTLQRFAPKWLYNLVDEVVDEIDV